jgi:2-dehydro-3-deoxyphosphogluconate aldolase/(4S)-4-hydroxy-2-oxoglutarate aldolase
MTTLNSIREHQLIAIIRGANPQDVIRIAGALYEGGIRLLEITMNSKDPLSVIEQVSDQFGGKMLIGAGTVLDAGMAREAIKAGAQFILSPIVDEDTIRATKDAGAVSIPGAYTPTEIVTAYRAGGDIIKVFPAGCGGAAYIRDVMGPLSHIPMLPTGGISLDNIGSFARIGVAGYGIGSSLVDTKQAVTELYLTNLTETARKFALAIQL